MGAAHADAPAADAVMATDADAAHGARAAANAVEMRWQLDPVRLSRRIASHAQVACWRDSEEFDLRASCLQQDGSAHSSTHQCSHGERVHLTSAPARPFRWLYDSFHWPFARNRLLLQLALEEP